MSLNRHFPNLHCWSSEVSVQEFTLEPDFSHLKLWLWVNLSFLIISAHSFIVHCIWIFKGDMQIPGILLIFPRERGRAYPYLILPNTSFRRISGGDVAPLWFPKLSALMRSATLSSLVMGLVGHCDSWASMFIMQVHREWCWRRGRSTFPFQNSDPYPIKDFTCTSKALPRSKLNLQKTWKFDSAASLFILNFKSGNSEHPLVNFTNVFDDLHHILGQDFLEMCRKPLPLIAISFPAKWVIGVRLILWGVLVTFKMWSRHNGHWSLCQLMPCQVWHWVGCHDDGWCDDCWFLCHLMPCQGRHWTDCCDEGNHLGHLMPCQGGWGLGFCCDDSRLGGPW